jgi:hypothetical protein
MPQPVPRKLKSYNDAFASDITGKRLPFFERFPSIVSFTFSERDDVQTLRIHLAQHCNLKDCVEQVLIFNR